MAKTALPVSFRLSPEVKTAAEKAAEDDHRSLSSLIEKVLADYLKRRGYLETSNNERHLRATHAAQAAGMAGEQIDRAGDKSASVKEQARRKRRLIKGPVEFRGVRSDLRKSKD